jgi:hypothetical protein
MAMRSEMPDRGRPGGGSRSERALVAAGIIALLATGLWAWSRGLNGPYHFDDYATPLGDPASQSLSAWQRHLPLTLRPVTKLTYALEAETGIMDSPAGRRVVSILLHSVSAGLLLLLIARLAPGAPIGAALLAAAWFVHPVHADGVLLASGRTAVLSNLFIIAALLALERSRAWISALLFACACLSRETALAALLPLGVLIAARHEGRWRVAIQELAPLLATSALVLWWILTTPRYLQLAEYSMLGRPFLSSVTSQVGAVPVGLGLLFHPAALSIDYGIPLPVKFTEPLFLVGLLLYIAAAAGIFMLRRRSRAAAVGLALWLAALLPTQSVVPKLDALANRPLSLALAGLLLAAAPLIGVVLSSGGDALAASTSREARRRRPSVAAVSVAVALVASLTAETSGRAKLFQSPLDLWQDAASKSRVNERPYVQYAVLLQQEGRHREALQALSVAARIAPFSSQIATMSRVFRSREVSP